MEQSVFVKNRWMDEAHTIRFSEFSEPPSDFELRVMQYEYFPDYVWAALTPDINDWPIVMPDKHMI